MTDARRMVPIPGATLHIDRRGKGPVALFLHGFGGDCQGWSALWARIAGERQLIRTDLRGFGASRADSDDPFCHADDLAALLDALGLDRVDLIGLSMGGSIALNFALDHPHRVRSLVLVSPGLTAWEWSDSWRALWAPIAGAARAGDMAGAKALWHDHPLFESSRELPGAAALLRAEIERFAGRQWIVDHQRDAMPDSERLRLLEPRTLLLTGERDMPDFRLIADLIEACAPDVTRADHAGHGHLLPFEDPIWCAAQITAFWRPSS